MLPIDTDFLVGATRRHRLRLLFDRTDLMLPIEPPRLSRQVRSMCGIVAVWNRDGSPVDRLPSVRPCVARTAWSDDEGYV